MQHTNKYLTLALALLSVLILCVLYQATGNGRYQIVRVEKTWEPFADPSQGGNPDNLRNYQTVLLDTKTGRSWYLDKLPETWQGNALVFDQFWTEIKSARTIDREALEKNKPAKFKTKE